MKAFWVAARIIREIMRDKRTLAFFFLAPVLVMTLIYFAIADDAEVKIGVVSRGVARLFDYDFVNALEEDEDVEVVSLDIPDDEIDPKVIEGWIKKALLKRDVDGVLYFGEELLVDRFDGQKGTLHVYVEGSKPIKTSDALSAIADAMDELAEQMPVVIDADCSAHCADSVNNKAMELEKHYLYGSDKYRLTDFFLPVFPTFFVFFFTFILSTITFQRERLRGTLERLYVAPISFWEIIVGYILGFLVFSTLQSTIIVTYILYLIEFPFSVAQVFSLGVVILFTMLVALTLGLLASFLAANEFQAIQFIPLVILPQVFLSDMIWDINGFPKLFQWISYIFPLTHSNIAARDIMIKNHSLFDSWPQLVTLTGFVTIVLVVMTVFAMGKEKTF